MHQCYAGCARVHDPLYRDVARGVDRASSQGWMDTTDRDGWTRLRDVGGLRTPRRPSPLASALVPPIDNGWTVMQTVQNAVGYPTRLVCLGELTQASVWGRVL